MISDIGSAAVLGFVLGPLFGLLGTYMTFELGPIYVDQYNACGYLQCIFTIIMIIATIFFFTEIPWEMRKNYLKKTKVSNENQILARNHDETNEQF